MHKYVHEPSVVYATMNGKVCHSRHTYACISLLTLAGRGVTGDRGAASQMARWSSHRNLPRVPASCTQPVKGRHSLLRLTHWPPINMLTSVFCVLEKLMDYFTLL